MRRALGVALAGAFILLPALPAYADGAGSIDHIEADSSKVKMLFAVPADAPAPDPESVRVDVNGVDVDATASAVEAGQIKRTVVLALDISSSMRGERFDAAKDATLAYLAAAPADVSIGLVTFAGSVTVIDSPTTDHRALQEAVAGLELSAGTRLYDGVLEALVQAGSDGQRDVIVLSDGADTSRTPLAEVVSGAEESGVSVSVVALEQNAAAQADLEKITDQTDGLVLPADDPAALAAVFTKQAEALAQQVLIRFDAPRSGEATVTASLSAGAETYTDSTFTTLTAAQKTAVSRGPIPVDSPSAGLDPKFLFIGVAALGIGLAAILAVILAGKPREKQSLAQRQLDFYSSGAHQPGSPPAAATRASFNVRESAVALADQVVKSRGLEAKLNLRLNAAGLSLTAAEWLLLHAGITVVGALVGLLLSSGNPVVIVLLLFGGLVGPWLYLRLKESRRTGAFNSQLADTLQLMSGGLSAGLSLPQAVDTVVREGSEPMAGELRRALVEQRLGVEIEDALDGVAERMGSKDFGWVVMAIRIQREVGGNLAELLNTVAATLREREYLRRQVKTLSAEGRLSAWILGGLPPFFVAYLALVRRDYLAPMVTTPIGWVMSALALTMLGVAAFWLAKTVKVEV